MAKHNFTFSKVRKMLAKITDIGSVVLPNNGLIEVHKEVKDEKEEILTFVWSKDRNYVKGFRFSEYADMGTYAEGIARTVRRRVGDVAVDGLEIFTDLPKAPKVKLAKRGKKSAEAVAEQTA